MTMTTTLPALEARKRPMTAEERKVIIASSAGTIFEWYDFYLYGSLAAIIGAQFFSAYPEATRNIFALLAFAAGFIVRPFGALVFGRLGDLIGRKYTFLITILIMGLSTFLVGCLPSYETIGTTAPLVLLALRMAQGLALGGEYGGAAIYVAEHAPQNRRGYFTSFIQTTATLGLLLSLVVIMFTQIYVNANFPMQQVVLNGTAVVAADGKPAMITAFNAWGWRIPFLASIVLLLVSLYIRLQMNESPAFKKMKEEGSMSKAPLSEAFGQWKNAKIALLALLGLTAGQAVVWYTGQFYALFFLQSILKVDSFTANVLIAWSLTLGTGFFIVFGALSDRIGRKPIILLGCLISAITVIPLFQLMAKTANPALYEAHQSTPVIVTTDKSECSFQFNPTGTAKFTSPCDVAKAALARASVKYSVAEFGRYVGDGQDRQPGADRGQGSQFRQEACSRADGRRLPCRRQPERREDPDRAQGRPRELRQDVRYLDNAAPHADRRSDHPGDLRDDGLRPDRRRAGRAVPDPHPLLRPVAAVSHR